MSGKPASVGMMTARCARMRVDIYRQYCEAFPRGYRFRKRPHVRRAPQVGRVAPADAYKGVRRGSLKRRGAEAAWRTCALVMGGIAVSERRRGGIPWS